MHSLNYKRIALIAAVLVSSVMTWAVAHQWLNRTDRFTDILAMLWPALTFIVAGAVTGLALMLMEHRADRLAAILTSWAVFVFFWTPNIWYVSALVVFFGFWWVAAQQMRHDLTDRRTIRVSTTLGQGMKLILLGWFLMVSLGFYLLPSSQDANITQISKNAQQSIQNVYNNPVIKEQLASLPGGSEAQIRAQVAEYVDTFIRAGLGPVRKFIPSILALGLFISLWSLNTLLRAPAVWLGTQLFRLLKHLGFVTITEQDVKAEVLSV